MKLKSFLDYNLGNTPLVKVDKYCPSGNLYLKLERFNPYGSIKDRTAYFIISDLIKSGRLTSRTKLVESSSGNLGLALGYLAREIGVDFICLVDPSIAVNKLNEMEEKGIKVHVVSKINTTDFRSPRVRLAQRLDQKSNWIWTNQYDNPSNFRSHYETTGPEIWLSTAGEVDYVVCSVGTGGTVCGVGYYLKKQKPDVVIVAVEPYGSTIFGGKPYNYLNVGAGMSYPSGIFKKYGHVVDYYCKVNDKDALQECVNILKKEQLSIGVTTGAVLVAALSLATNYPFKTVVAIAPDGGEKYVNLFDGILPSYKRELDMSLSRYTLELQ